MPRYSIEALPRFLCDSEGKRNPPRIDLGEFSRIGEIRLSEESR